jgi:hypothetical protein
LHNSKINWDTYRQIKQDKVNLSSKLKEHEGIGLETNKLLSLLQHAAKEATPNSDPQRTTNKVTHEIKKLVVERRRARSIWQRTHTPDSRRIYTEQYITEQYITEQYIAEQYITEQATNLNPHFKKCDMIPLKNMFLILKGKIALFGNI